MVWADKLRQTEAGKTFDQSWEWIFGGYWCLCWRYESWSIARLVASWDHPESAAIPDPARNL